MNAAAAVGVIRETQAYVMSSLRRSGAFRKPAERRHLSLKSYPASAFNNDVRMKTESSLCVGLGQEFGG